MSDQNDLMWRISEGLQRHGQIRTQGEIRDVLERIEQQNQGVAECPWCAGPIPKKNVEVCKNCGRDLAWATAPSNPNIFVCCKPDEIEGWALAIANWEIEQREKADAAQREIEVERRAREELRRKSPIKFYWQQSGEWVLVLIVLMLVVIFALVFLT